MMINYEVSLQSFKVNKDQFRSKTVTMSFRTKSSFIKCHLKYFDHLKKIIWPSIKIIIDVI